MTTRRTRMLCLLLTLALLLAPSLQGAHPHHHAHAEDAPELIRGTFQYAGMYNNQQDSTLDYAYSDAYFAGDAREYNPSLSTMSLALEMSSWSSLDEENWVDKTANARELLTATGFEHFAQNDFWNDVPSVDSIGVVAASKELGDATLIALAVRGGGYFSEWGSNVLIGADNEHEGFATARDNVLAFLRSYTAEHGITGRIKLWLVGYSRSAAVANMTAGYLNQHPLTEEIRIDPADLYCYTVEAPQGILVSEAGPDADHRNIHNIINPNDIVPLAAPDGWGFTRYNQTSHLLPTITTAQYPQAREQMLQQYERILSFVDVLTPEKAAYNVAEYAKTLEMKINWLSFLPGGEPAIELQVVDNSHLPQSVMLTEFVSLLAQAGQSRDRFHANIEADISTLLADLLHADKGASLSDYIQELGEVLTEDDFANLVYILEPIVQLNLTPFETRMNEVADRLREVIPQPEGYTDIVGTVSSLVDVISTMLVEDPQTVLNLILSLANTNMIQAHYAEVTMAWLRTEDPNFTDTPFTASVPEAMRIVRVNCPVDLMVYDAQGSLVASIVGGTATSFAEGIGCAINSDGEMVLYLPSDAEYSVQIIATGDGTVSCSINEFNVVRSKHTYVVNYPDVPIQTGDALTALIPPIPEDERTDEAASGSTADYQLLDAGNAPIQPQNTLRGDDAVLYTVKAERNNEYGQVLGGGSYISDSFAQLTAYPVSGGAFIGWFVDDQQVSAEQEYRFPVTQDVTVVAHFAEATLWQVSFSSGEGGTVHNVSTAYPAGSIVLLSAGPDEGYMLDKWTATAGEIHYDPDEKVTYFIVPEGNATVTASFVPAGIVCPGCQTQLPEGVTHYSPCKRIGHYTCDPDYNPYLHRRCEICDDGYVCMGSHGAGKCGMSPCEGCGVEIPTTESHAAPCGTAGHWTCAADYDAAEHATCAHCSALLCDGNDHGECTICGSGFVCEGGHGYGSGECGVYVCEGCGVEILITESHAAPCGTAGHWTCAADYNAAEHTTCPHCSALLCDGNDHGECTICGSGYVCEGGHGYGSGECGVYVCEGCGVEILITESHAAPCGTAGHWTCAADYDAAEHTTCAHCSALLCDGADHGECTICGSGYVCEGGHGYGSGECGVYVCAGCGVEILITESHAASCGTAGHWTCAADYVAAEHATCTHCSALLCDGNDHGECTICGDGYVCEGGHGYGSGECGVYVCEGCGVEILITESHAAPCGTAGHWTCTADYDAAEHATCPHCSALLCDGNDHGECTICGDGFVCEGGHGYGSGECGVYVCEGCGVEILITESHAAPCGTAGHWTCVGSSDHSVCPVCLDYKCNSADHGICPICSSTYCNGMEHGYDYGQCGNLNTSALVTCLRCGESTPPFEMHLGECNRHYTCADGSSPEDHWLCYFCGEGYFCEGGHGTDEGQCSYVEPTPVPTDGLSSVDAGAEATATPTPTAALSAAIRPGQRPATPVRSAPPFILPGLTVASLAILLTLRRRKKRQ